MLNSVDHPDEDAAPREPAPVGRPAPVTIGGGILIAGGALIALIGLVVVILGILYSDPASLPPWADLAPAGLTPAASLAGLGAIVYGIVQTATGIAVQHGARWSRSVGIGLALAGAALAAAGLRPFGGAEASGASFVFLPVMVGYLFAAWALLIGARWFRTG
jgi:hypothetical protein